MNSESCFLEIAFKMFHSIAFVIKKFNRDTLDVIRNDVMLVNRCACFVFQRIEMFSDKITS